LQQLVSEKDLIVWEEACRVGLLFGGFTGSLDVSFGDFKEKRRHTMREYLMLTLLPLYSIQIFDVQDSTEGHDGAELLAGSVAGLAIVALDDSRRTCTLSLYLLARLAQVGKTNQFPC
jgi:hypothetical protein